MRREIVYQVKRLRDHACIALWCGDNENIGALTWFDEPRANRDRYLLDWDRLNTVRADAARLADDTRLYWPSSPCAGPGDFTDTFHADGKGDMHYWAVWHEGKGFDAYHAVRPRFCSEFGYQSFPSLATVQTYCPPTERNITAPAMEFHQRNDAGNRRIVEMFTRYFRMPAGFAETLYLSQVQQAVAIKTAVEWWRTLRPECMGTLYWQLNDVWPVASWSSLEYGGKWKQLHHHARRFYAPVMACVIARGPGAAVELWTVNDLNAPGEAEVTAELWTFAGEILRTERVNVPLRPGSAALVKRWEPDALASTASERAGRFLQITLRGQVESASVAHENTHWFTEFKRCALVPATVECAARGSEVTVSSDAPAFFVQVEASEAGVEFDDNSITVLPGRPRKLCAGRAVAPGSVTAMHLARCG